MGRFIQYYRENARYLERTYGFVERVGVERLRQIIMDDSDGLADDLETGIQDSVDAYFDPWKEGAKPIHPNQFATAPIAAPV